MLRAVIKKELLGHLVSFRFLISTLIMLVLAALAASVGTQDFSVRHGHYQNRLSEHEEELDRVHVYSQLNPVVARAPEPLSVVHRGFDTRFGTEVKLDIFSIPTTARSHLNGNHLVRPSRDLDLTMIVRVVLGLLALLLTFDAVVGERERGTLKLIFANGISRPVLVAGKFMGAFFALLVPLLASLCLSLWILIERGNVILDDQRWQRLAGLILAYVAYLSVMLLLGLLLSIVARSTSVALVYALLSWLVIVFLIPQSAIAVAEAVSVKGIQAPEEALVQLVAKRDAELSDLRRDYDQSVPSVYVAPIVEMSGTRGVLYWFGAAPFYDVRMEYHSQETAIGMKYAERIFRLEQQTDGQRRQVESLANLLASMSPAFQLDRIAASFAATSVEDHDSFLAECRALRQRLIEYLKQRDAFSSWRWFTDDEPANLKPWPSLLGVEPENVGDTEVRQLMERFQSAEIQDLVQLEKTDRRDDPERWLRLDNLPIFQVTSPSFWQAGRRVASEVALLLLTNGALAGAVWWRFAGYTVK